MALEPGARVFVAGVTTMAGQALLRRLRHEDLQIVGTALDESHLRDPARFDAWFADVRPDVVFVVAGEQAGIGGNLERPADLMIDSLRVAASVIPAAATHGAALLYLGSSCVYPRAAPPPLAIESLGTGPLEPTSAAYAQARLAGMALVDASRRQYGLRFINAIPADVYGPGDDFSAGRAHVAAALLRRIHEAQRDDAPSVDVWGSGTPRREFLFVDDLADACVFVMRHYDGAAPVNIGTGETTSVAELARAIADVAGYQGDLRFDTSRPDGMPFKGLDSSPLRALGWRPRWRLRDGLEATYDWFVATLVEK